MVALVDDEDHPYVSQFNWSVDGSGYPQRSVKTDAGWRPLRMHRDLLHLGPGEAADHINGDKLDTRRANLRVCTAAENTRNVGLSRNNRTGFKGVHFNKSRGTYQAYITVNLQHRFIGQFSDPIEAAKAYDRAAIDGHREFARPNFAPECEKAG